MNSKYNAVIESLNQLYQHKTTVNQVKDLIDELLEDAVFLPDIDETEFKDTFKETEEEMKNDPFFKNQISIDDLELNDGIPNV